MSDKCRVDKLPDGIGHIVHYSPKHPVFAQTTGAKKPQPKPRPCVIIGRKKGSGPIIAPITTAKPVPVEGQPGKEVLGKYWANRRTVTEGDKRAWLPVHYKGAPEVIVPEDTGCNNRSPAVIKHKNRCGGHCYLLPGYIWCRPEYPDEEIPVWEYVYVDEDRRMTKEAIDTMHAQY